jgi:hypothetical protein
MDNTGKALDTTLWKMFNGMVPTGTSTQIIRVLDVNRLDQPPPRDARMSPQEQSVELVQQAAGVYRKLRDQARQRFEATGRLQALLDFVGGEPLTLQDQWVRDVLIERLNSWDDDAVKSILRALKPKRPKVRKEGDAQQAAAYYRWVVATVSDRILSGKSPTVSQAIRTVVLFSDEADAKRAAAGLAEPGEDRARHTYYGEARRYVWRAMVMAGLGLVSTVLPDER